jgi:hypothetical protein
MEPKDQLRSSRELATWPYPERFNPLKSSGNVAVRRRSPSPEDGCSSRVERLYQTDPHFESCYPRRYACVALFAG